MLYTTLHDILDCNPSLSTWTRLLTYLNKKEEDDEPIGFSVLLDSIGFLETIWSMQTSVVNIKSWQRYGLNCCQSTNKYLTDETPKLALKAIEEFQARKLSLKELDETAEIIAHLYFNKGPIVALYPLFKKNKKDWLLSEYAEYYAISAIHDLLSANLSVNNPRGACTHLGCVVCHIATAQKMWKIKMKDPDCRIETCFKELEKQFREIIYKSID